jgi:predicted nucleic acid-binding protein
MMYLLDTNVISELRKANSERMDSNVQAWANEVSPASMYLSAICILELERGTLLMERRDAAQARLLRSWLENHVLPSFAGRVLPVDIAVARRCATMHVPSPRSYRDSLIAATALVHGMTMVTRNTLHFEPTGASLLNPWEG